MWCDDLLNMTCVRDDTIVMFYDLKWGALRMMAMRRPARVPAIGMVMIQEKTRRPTRWKLTALRVPLQRPTPTVAPVMHMEVETGSEYCEKTRTVMAAPISIEQPREGEW